MFHHQPQASGSFENPAELAALIRQTRRTTISDGACGGFPANDDRRFAKQSPTLAGTSAAEHFFRPYFASADAARETLLVAHVDARVRCIHLASYDGDQSGAEFPVRRILLDAAAIGSKGVVLAHNHPSGDARPSTSDRESTRRLAQACDAIDVVLLDHLLFAGEDVTSMRTIGLL